MSAADSKCGFTILELLVATSVVALIVVLAARLFSGAASLTTVANKRFDADAQARALLDRMSVDFSQMVRRADVDYYVKTPAITQSGNDQIAFYSTVPGYNPATGSASPLSLVGYRINSAASSPDLHKMQRLSKGLVWNGITTATPLVFLPLTLASTWPAATDSTADPDYELIAPYTFRFEYSYLLRNGSATVTPWDVAAGRTNIDGMQDVVAISISIAVIDPRSRVLLSSAQLATLVGRMDDASSALSGGDLIAQWQAAINGSNELPRPAVSSIRLYQRWFNVGSKP